MAGRTEEIPIVTGTFEKSASAIGYTVVGPPRVQGTNRLYPAVQSGSADRVALQPLTPGVDEARLFREGRILRSISHPGVAAFRELVHIDGIPTLVLDRVEGDTLASVLERRDQLSLNEVELIVDQLSSALDAVHAHGVVHRDLSPTTVMVSNGSGDAGPKVCIVDFGVSCRSDDAEIEADADTGRYVAPETIAGERPTARADQYALAIIAQEMLTGSWPFPESDAFGVALHHHLHSLPTPVRKLVPALPDHVENSLLRALEKNPENRFPTLRDFSNSLRGLERTETPPQPKQRRFAWTARQQVLAVGALLIGLLLGGLLAFLRSEPVADPAQEEESVTDVARDAQVPDNADLATSVTSLSCNLVTEGQFESPELPANFYALATNLDREQVVPGAGAGGSGALEVGDPGVVGLYGEVVEVEAGQSYVVSLHSRIDGDVSAADVRVEWLDVDQDVVAESASLDLLALPSGRQVLVAGAAPRTARFAVPRIHKGEGPGVLFVDELVFADTASECGATLLADG